MIKRILVIVVFFAASAGRLAALPESGGAEYREYQTIRFDGDGVILGYAVHDYNDAGLKLESRWYNAEGDYEMVTFYEYDEQGRLTKESRYDKSESILFSYTTHTYNREGTRVSSKDFNSEDRHILWIDYSGAEGPEGVPKQELGYAADGRPVFRVENTLDGEARKSESTVYELSESGESPGSRGTYTYNRAGNLVRTEIFTPENTLLWYMEHKWEKVE